MAGPCQNKGWGVEKWGEKKAETDLNGRPRASFSYKAIFTELKKYDFRETSATFLSTHQMLRLPRYLKYCHVCTSLPLRFVETAPSPRQKMLRLEGRDGPKWPAPAKIRGDRVQGWKMGEGGTNERAETDLNGRPLPE